jgi:hypothetical protein
MTTTIIPDEIMGALPWDSPSVENATRPDAPFAITCDYLALPTDCSARIMPDQINAIVSELLNLAGCFNPDGTWDCGATDNLCANFTAYRTDTGAGVNLFNDIQALLCGATQEVAELPSNAELLWCDGEGTIKTSPLDVAKLLCDSVTTDPTPPSGVNYLWCAGGEVFESPVDFAAEICNAATADPTPPPEAGFLWCDGSGGLFTSPMVIPDPPPEGLSHGIRGTVAITAADRTLDSSTVPPFGMTTINIPNTSSENIVVLLSMIFEVNLIELVDGGQGQLSFSRFTNADGSGGVIQECHMGARNINPPGTPVMIFKPAAMRQYTIPPGGIDMYFGFEGGAAPDNAYRVEVIAGKIEVYGVYAATFDVIL